MKPRELTIQTCPLKDIRNFVETHHYSHNVNGVKISYCFKIIYQDRLVGGVIFGQLSTTAWKKFANSESKVLELRRLVLLDEAEYNSESYVIGWTIRWLKKNAPSIEILVSYADPLYGHSGTIYKATNWTHIGMTPADKGFKDQDTGKVYHSRALRTKYKGEYKPFVKVLREKHEAGLLEVVTLPGKHCYIFRLTNS